MKRFAIFITSIALSAIALTAHAAIIPLAERYQLGQLIRVLVVPGHDNEFSGSSGNGIREADVNLRLAADIAAQLRLDPQISVTLSRDATTGEYIPELANYFDKNEDDIWDFINEYKKSYAHKQKQIEREAGDEAFDEPAQVPHGDAKPTVAFRLYGTNKWANEQMFDLILHVHFNDTWPRGGAGGEYGGYSIYVPGVALKNQIPSDSIGSAIGNRIRDIVPKSNLWLESSLANDAGAISDTKLIALGSYDTLDIPSILVEYSYIYEPHIAPNFWDVTVPAMARATDLGLHDYLRGTRGTASTFNYRWDENLVPSTKIKKPEVVALQMGLRSLGLYPPTGKTQNDCPMTGAYGPCTKAAVTAFQKQHALGADGLFGAKTRAVMNGLFKE